MEANHKNCALILALDVETKDAARKLLSLLGHRIQWVKIGLQMFTAYGPNFVREIADQGYQVFLDLKLHDIPNTVAKAVQSIAQLPISILTVHACGGPEMLRYAQQASQDYSGQLDLHAVTVLTSMDTAQLRSLNVSAELQSQVLDLAALSIDAGLPGLVCSAQELGRIRQRFGTQPRLITPGIRPQGVEANDQKRTMSPDEAARAGSDYIVVGRPIIQDPAPDEMVDRIQAELSNVSLGRP
jgi:orotidine-5'-phosphate decarboxylase